MGRKRKHRPFFDSSGYEDILNVAYRLDATAEFRKTSGINVLPTYEWLKEQAKVLRRALEKEGLK